MEINEYQNQIINFITYPPELGPFYNTISLQNDIGNLSNKIKDLMDDPDQKIDRQYALKIAINLGDILGHVSNLANDMGLTLEELCALNLKKLQLEREKTKSKQNQNITKYENK